MSAAAQGWHGQEDEARDSQEDEGWVEQGGRHSCKAMALLSWKATHCRISCSSPFASFSMADVYQVLAVFGYQVNGEKGAG